MKIELYQEDKGKPSKAVRKLSQELPKPRFFWPLIGFSGSGKSTYIKNIVFNWYRNVFSEIYIWCGSLDDCEEYQRIAKSKRMLNKVQVINELDLDEVQELYKELEEENLHLKKKKHFLFVFDDHITNGLSSSYKPNVIDMLAVKSRHANLSVVLSTQKYRMLNNNLRCINTTAITIFGSNHLELEQIAKEHCNFLSPDQLLDILKQTQEEKYNCITIDYSKDAEDRFRNKNLQKIDLKK